MKFTGNLHECPADEASCRANSRLQLAIECAGLATWDWNLRTNEVIRDAAWFEILGFERERIQDSSFWIGRVNPHDITEMNALWEAHCKDETKAFRAEYRVLHKTGEWRWMLTHGRVVERDEKGPTRACGINQDVTERRRSEDALANSERFSHLLLETTQDCVAVLDGFGYMLYLNPAGLDRLGLADPNCVRGRCWIELWPAESRDNVRQELKNAFAGNSGTFEAFCQAGHVFHGSWSVVLSYVAGGPDEPRRILAVAREITRLKEQEERKQERLERERLQATFENLNEGMIIAAPDGLVLLMNRAARQMYGFDPASDKTVQCEDFLEAVEAGDSSYDAYSLADPPLARALRGEAFTGVETLLRNRRNGRQWIASCGSTPVRSASGELIRAVLSIRDVTGERRATDEIRHANVLLHGLSGQLLRLQDEERKRIARELYDGTAQNLSAVLMNLSLLGDTPELRKLNLDRGLLQETQNLTRQCVKELRTLSYLLHSPVLDELGLAPAVRSWIDGFSETTGIPVDISMPEMRRLTPDVETALFRIIQEGLGNVHRHANASTASVRSAIEGGTIRLEITDDGQGFDSVPSGEGREKYKASVGLLGMRERAEQLGGSMSIESTPGGTEIIVIIPTVIPVDTMDVCDAQNS